MLRKALRWVAAFWFWVLVFCAAYWLLSLASAALANAFIAPDYCFFRVALLPHAVCTGLGVGQGTHHLLGLPVAILVLPLAFGQFALAFGQAEFWVLTVFFALLHVLAVLYAAYRFGSRNRILRLETLFGHRAQPSRSIKVRA